MIIIKKLIIVILIAGALGGCGFQLHNARALPVELSRVHIIGDDRELVMQLAAALSQHGAAIIDSPDAARINLGGGFTRETLSVDAFGRALTYALTYRIMFTAAAADGAPLSTAQTIYLRRAFDYNAALQLDAEYEESFLKTELRGEAAVQITRRLLHYN